MRSNDGAGVVTIEAPNSAASCRMLESSRSAVVVIHDNSLAKREQEIWDIAPVLLIVEEVGGQVSDIFGSRYTIGRGSPVVITRNESVHRDLFALLLGGGHESSRTWSTGEGSF